MRKIMGKKAKKSSSKEEKLEYEIGSGNVFQDFRFANPEEAKAKSDLAFLIRLFIKKNGLTQEEAAIMMGMDQPKISKITRGLLSEFTLERLLTCLVQLGFDIEIKPTISKSVTPSIHVASAGLVA
jgi:predicted XRE-type DNA-binding protein